MKVRGSMKKSQSILEYLVMLTVIIAVICIYTFWHFPGLRPEQIPAKNLLGVNRALDNVQQKLHDLAHDDYAGETVDWSEVPVYDESTAMSGGL